MLEDKAKKAIPVVEGDYQKDGIWYCGKCNTPKQKIVKLLGEIRKPMCLCKCKSDFLKQEQEKERQIEIQNQLRLSKIDALYSNYTFASDNKPNSQESIMSKNYLSNFEHFRKSGQGLLFWGKCGRGKTFYACSIANALKEKGYRITVKTLVNILYELEGTFNKQGYINDISQCDLVVIDDFSLERQTPYVLDMIYAVITGCYNLVTPVLITTNLTLDDLKNPQDENNYRITERILAMCVPIQCAGENQRRLTVKEKYAEAINILKGKDNAKP